MGGFSVLDENEQFLKSLLAALYLRLIIICSTLDLKDLLL